MISARFESLRARGERALVLFVTAGDPSLEALPAILETLQGAGADLIEIGIPFSDPIADGPTIQASSQRALDRGTTPAAVLDTLASVRLEAPIVLMGYWNPVLRVGPEAFAARARAAGVSGVILSDLTPEESDEWRSIAQGTHLDTIFLVAPTSTDERIALACARSTGFVYAVSRTGVTGANSSASPEASDLVRRTRSQTSLPICVGFGISTPEHVRTLCRIADGVVIGSLLVDMVASEWDDGRGAHEIARAVRSLKAATKE